MQVELHTELEEKLPYWLMKRVDKPSITMYPNKLCGLNSGVVFKVKKDYHHMHAVPRVVDEIPRPSIFVDVYFAKW